MIRLRWKIFVSPIDRIEFERGEKGVSLSVLSNGLKKKKINLQNIIIPSVKNFKFVFNQKFETISNLKILVTGGLGYIGSQLRGTNPTR